MKTSVDSYRVVMEICFILVIQVISLTRATFLFDEPIKRSTCITSGGTCEPVLSCLMSLGVASGSCGGFWNVCCARPSAVNRWLQDNRATDQRHSSYTVEKQGRVINDPQCGLRAGNRRVIDGADAGFGTFPWQALVRIGKAKCGGVLINQNHVVTAGHCVKNKQAHNINVTLGEYHLGEAMADGEIYPSETYRIKSLLVHPNFKFSPAADRFDVAVLQLSRPVRYAPHITPICLPDVGKDPEPGTLAYATGWGAIIPDDKLGPLAFLVPKSAKRPKVLQVVDVPLIENSECESWHQRKGITVRLYDEMLCAGYKYGGKDSCKGDSGGPLMVRQRDGRFVLVGLVSAGFSCGRPGQPGIYHRVSSTSDWISYHANSLTH